MAKKPMSKHRKITVSFYGDLRDILLRAAEDGTVTNFVHEIVRVEAHRRFNTPLTINGRPVVYAEDFHATLETIEGVDERTLEIVTGLTARLERLTRFQEATSANITVIMEAMQAIMGLLTDDHDHLTAEMQAVNQRAQARFNELLAAVQTPKGKLS